MTYKIGTVGEFMRWTKRVVANPATAADTPKRWFDSKASAEAALAETSPEAMVKLLSPENLEMLKIIGTVRLNSMRELASLVRRKESNLSRTLKKLERAGIVGFESGPGRTLAPRLLACRVTLDLDLVGTSGKVSVQRPVVR
ncbi:Predicted transcriptional regulator [Rhizobiales bacterium GAS113]|jgi:predicted transcriptional regulator|nr:Predicted transcriptional regulator [Rhizobiales bacterium GAS113]